MSLSAGYHDRGYLPHIKVIGAAYFVTFRLADSLPRDVVLRLKERHDDLLACEADSEGKRRELFAWYAAEVDSALDKNQGSAWLKEPHVADAIASALRHFDGDRYSLFAWVVMPNHVHAVIRPQGQHTLSSILHSWKSFTATQANRLLNRIGKEFWQRESYDHWIRDDTDFAHCCDYTIQNPVKAGLCAKPEEWKWSSAAASS